MNPGTSLATAHKSAAARGHSEGLSNVLAKHVAVERCGRGNLHGQLFRLSAFPARGREKLIHGQAGVRAISPASIVLYLPHSYGVTAGAEIGPSVKSFIMRMTNALEC